MLIWLQFSTRRLVKSLSNMSKGSPKNALPGMDEESWQQLGIEMAKTEMAKQRLKEGSSLFQSASAAEAVFATIENLAKNDELLTLGVKHVSGIDGCPLPGIPLFQTCIVFCYKQLDTDLPDKTTLNNQAWAYKRMMKMIRDKAIVRQHLPHVRCLVNHQMQPQSHIQ